ncbi:hypothetical protein VNO80_16545 [Phaseolus coccineus]|uniref:Uncharacterized protein n=1 Tax=Phaseolus coccineus TaxID=3886 RepID=A0AAN9R3B4_PHACN
MSDVTLRDATIQNGDVEVLKVENASTRGVFAIAIVLCDVSLSTTSLRKKKASTLDVTEAYVATIAKVIKKDVMGKGFDLVKLLKMGATFKDSNLVTIKRAKGLSAAPPPVKHAKVLPGSLPSTIDSSRVNDGFISAIDITSSQ